MLTTANIVSFSTVRSVVLKQNTGDALSAFEVKTAEASGKGVRVKLLGSFVSPLDKAILQKGVVGKPVGQIGLAEVVEGGSGFSKGEKVLATGGGAWQSEFYPTNMVKVSSAVNAENLADFVGHAQALKLLSGLKAGDVVVVSDAQSPLGLGVSRVGKKMGLKVVAVVGGHLQTDVTLKRLRSAGAEIVAAEEYDNGKSYVVSSAFRRLLKDLPGTRVAISGSGGLYAHEIALTLGNQGILYVVGGAPFTLPASLFLEKGIIVRGPETPSAENYEEAANMVKDLSKDIATPTVKFDLFKEVGKAVDALGMGPVSLLKA